MQKLDKEIIKLITKYPFLTDPIVLFNPTNIPTKGDILKGKLNLRYLEIEKNKKRLDKIKKDYYKIIDILHESVFDTLYLKIEYSHRLKDFYKIIRIIEIFYEKNEYEKYNLINEYFGIDFELLEEIFSNKEFLINEFKFRNTLLSEKKTLELDSEFINASGIKFFFDKAIKFLGLEDNWKVVVGNAVGIVHTNFNEKGGEILIPSGYNVSIKDLLGLIAHEIDGHCVQFTNCGYLSSGTIRYSKSESLAEGFAMYNEYFFSNKIFGENTRIFNLYRKNKDRFDFIENKIYFKEFVGKYKGKLIRVFRGFSNIIKYKNLKDFVYIQGLYNVIKYRKKYNNFFELIKSGAVNDSYIKKYGNECGRKEKIKLENMSAYFILKKYFYK